MVDLSGANDGQKKAITNTEGPMLIIAGPGTGKTYTLVKRIAYLVFEKNADPSSIMVVTFTEKAAKELLTRISDEFMSIDVDCKININDMYIGTFHSVCLRLMKEYSEELSGNKQSRVIDAFEQAYIVCRNMEEFCHLRGFNGHIASTENVRKQEDWKNSMKICRYVNQMMEERVDVQAMSEDEDEDLRFLGKLVLRYRSLLARKNVMDFSSIQTKTLDMLDRDERILQAVQEKIRYIMVDEYQDTNYIQEQLVLKLAGKSQNICVVGDDDQGMYRFRGATIRNILEFADRFQKDECKVIYLDENYRSEPGIIRFYSSWMADSGAGCFDWGKYRFPKRLKACKTGKSDAPAVYACAGASPEAEKEEVLAFVKKLKTNGNITDLNQIAFLFRSVKGSEAREIAEFLEANGFPVYSPRSEMFFERTEVKQALGCIMFCFPHYIQGLKNDSFRYPISSELKEYYKACRREAVTLIRDDDALKGFLEQWTTEIRDLSDDSEEGLLDILYRLFAFEPFRRYLEVDITGKPNVSRSARNLSEISRMIARFSFLHNMHHITGSNKEMIAEQLFNIYLKYMYVDGVGEYEDEANYAPSGCISFMTIHQSKGLEFPVVVVGSLGNVPKKEYDPLMYSAECRYFHRPPYEPREYIRFYDFWRLYYVAFSRAQNMLVLATKKDDPKYFGTMLGELPKTGAFHKKDQFEKVRSLRFRRVYSFTSHIGLYDGCPTQYKFYKEYGFAQNKMFHTSVGSLVHATLEDMNKCIINGEKDRVNEEAIKEWFSLNYRSMQEQTGYSLTDEQQEKALSQVIRYFRHRKNELGKVWKAEEEINLVLNDYILQGIIDLVEGDGDTVEIVDYKTGPKPDIRDNPHRIDHYKKQLEIYAYLIEKRYGKKVSRMHLYYTGTLDGDPIISFEWSRNAIDETIQEITRTVQNIEAKKFELKAQNTYACEYCDMRYVCEKR
ncbi:ATP-dependent helicase [[Clostridium] aminophilum]|uniref:DNA 3'-5' helicase n=1 Tax=[Clostridium] aminophilum TaxID=1526 RepID=A0A1I6KGK5_9FIRM|nr:ATP-dependent DNA helicase [[Clostridium] aminophilum]SFR90375.1 DNA helicase-2 / ATP-dependent DNA helicase PcrA [[Clostridium] aminophilum]